MTSEEWQWEKLKWFRRAMRVKKFLTEEIPGAFNPRIYLRGWNLKDFILCLRLSWRLTWRFEATHGKGSRRHWKEAESTDVST